MKPPNWDTMSTKDKHAYAAELCGSARGRYIIGQALARAIEVMATGPYPETSNIQDMEMLGETLFVLGYGLTLNRTKIPTQPTPPSTRDK